MDCSHKTDAKIRKKYDICKFLGKKSSNLCNNRSNECEIRIFEFLDF